MISKTKYLLLALSLTLAVSASSIAQQTVTAGAYMVQLENDPKTITVGSATTLDIFVMDSQSMAPSTGLVVTASLKMPSMAGMSLEQPTVVAGKTPGHYSVSVRFPHAGSYELELKLQPASGTATTLTMTISPGKAAEGTHQMTELGGMAGMEMGPMKGVYGGWPMSREGSGTSWQPDSSPMFMKMLPKSGRYDLSVMGTVQAGYVDSGGKRGQRQVFSNSMGMLMGRREVGGGTFGFDFMASLDPVINGKRGVPNLFQTGETLNGNPLVDRQHPHDFISEAAVSYSHSLGGNLRGFVYGGPIGEPALGNVMFMHRASGMEIPEAPISHHWFDSTHISYGVATAGFTAGDQWKIEGSVFNGHEPNENRFDIDPIALNSVSGRISYNPDKNWSFSASYGYLKSPEQLEPGVDQHRITASAAYSQPLAGGDNWSTSALFGKLIVPGKRDSNAYVLESTLYHRRDAIFARFERVDKDELVGVPEGSYTVNKLLIGDTHNFLSSGGFDLGLGAYVGLYSSPSALKPYYGNSPVTFGVFLRLRPSRM